MSLALISASFSSAARRVSTVQINRPSLRPNRIGWGKRPLADDDDKVVEYTVDVGRELFTATDQGKVLFGKVMQNAVSDEVFLITEEDRKYL